jgi:hypothetical protein
MTEMGQSRLGGVSCRSSHVRNAPLAIVGPKKVACREGPIADKVRCGKNLSYSITSSAVASSVAGTVRPSALAVLRLITSSYLSGSCTGRSAGLPPLRMRST